MASGPDHPEDRERRRWHPRGRGRRRARADGRGRDGGPRPADDRARRGGRGDHPRRRRAPGVQGLPDGRRGTPFPGSLCISVNDVVVHGFPSETAAPRGRHRQRWTAASSSAAISATSPTRSPSARCREAVSATAGRRPRRRCTPASSRPSRVTASATSARPCSGCARAQATASSATSSATASASGCTRRPNVPNLGRRGMGKKLLAGMTICIEPMINGGTGDVTIDHDGWTVRTARRRAERALRTHGSRPAGTGGGSFVVRRD